MTTQPIARSSAAVVTLSLCFAIALLEGLDLQSVGVAAPRMAREFGLSVAQMGLAFSAGTFGLLPGAMFGGRLADRIGRKRVLILSACVFGLLSIATALVSSFNMLVLVRVLTGIGLGGALPNLIALSSEAVSNKARNTAVSVMYCGIPFGGVIASIIGIVSMGDTDWRHIFYVGGAGPLILVPLLFAFLPESKAFNHASHGGSVQPAPVGVVLFGASRGLSTLQIWISYFCTLIVLYFLLNWLPSLMAARGLARAEVGYVQIFFNIGGGIGALCIGMLMDRLRGALVVSGMYIGIIASLAALVDGARLRRARGLGVLRGHVRDRRAIGALCALRSVLSHRDARHGRRRRGGGGTRRLGRRAARRWPVACDGPQFVGRDRGEHPGHPDRRRCSADADSPPARDGLTPSKNNTQRFGDLDNASNDTCNHAHAPGRRTLCPEHRCRCAIERHAIRNRRHRHRICVSRECRRRSPVPDAGRHG